MTDKITDRELLENLARDVAKIGAHLVKHDEQFAKIDKRFGKIDTGFTDLEGEIASTGDEINLMRLDMEDGFADIRSEMRQGFRTLDEKIEGLSSRSDSEERELWKGFGDHESRLDRIEVALDLKSAA